MEFHYVLLRQSTIDFEMKVQSHIGFVCLQANDLNFSIYHFYIPEQVACLPVLYRKGKSNRLHIRLAGQYKRRGYHQKSEMNRLLLRWYLPNNFLSTREKMCSCSGRTIFQIQDQMFRNKIHCSAIDL